MYSLIGEGGFLPSIHHSSQLYIGQWLSDTPIYFDTFEIIAEKARRFWWGQQVDLATTAFSLLLAIEGQRRHVPTTMAFLALAHLVNLSFAQNLFYLSLLLTPSPLSSDEGPRLLIAPLYNSTWRQIRDKFLSRKPVNWYPHPLLMYGALILNYGSMFILPYAAGTQSFTNSVLLTRGSTFLPLILPKIVPVKWGKVHVHPHDTYSSLTTLFRFVSTVSFLLYFKATTTALLYNVPNSHYHRHSVLIPWDVEERSTWERSTTAVGKVIGSISDHPAVTAVGYDVLISGLSLGLWAAFRATDFQDIAKSAIPFYNYLSRSGSLSTPSIKKETPNALIQAKPEPTEETEPEPEPSMTLRRSGRQRKPRLGSIANSSEASEEPTGTVTRKRGRPKKSKPVEEESVYEPTPSESREAVEGDIVPPSELDWESTALVWGLAAVGGLASASAGVFGGECISR